MTDALARWWWVPAGILIAIGIAVAFGSGLALALMAIYTLLNLVGTGLILREITDQEESPRSDRWRLLVQLAFVLQLPVGTVALLTELL